MQQGSLNDSDFVKDGNLKVVEPASTPSAEATKPFVEEPTEEFIQSDFYDGSRPGYAFKMGEQGLGYYRDRRQKLRYQDAETEKSPDILYQREKAAAEEKPSQSTEPLVVEVSSQLTVEQDTPASAKDQRSLWTKELLKHAEREAQLQSKVASAESEDASDEPAFEWMENSQNLRLIFTIESSQDVADIRLVQSGLRLAVSYCVRPHGSREGVRWVRWRWRRGLRRGIDLQQWHAELRPEETKCVLIVVVRKIDQEIWGEAFDEVAKGESWDDLDVDPEEEKDAGDAEGEDVAGDALGRSEGLVDSAELDIAEPAQRKEASTTSKANTHVLAAGVVPAGGMKSATAAAASNAVQSASVMGMAVLLKNKMIYTLV
jgi:hypothetical protein